MAATFQVGLTARSSSERDSRLYRILWAEEQGYESIWITDGGGRMDGLTLCAAAAVKTSRIRICLSVVPVYTRPVAVLATSAMSISQFAPNRFVMGLGASSHTMVQEWYGTPFEKPLTRVKETAILLRKIFAGEKTDFDGETVSSHNFRLDVPVQGRIPIYMAALRPKMLEMAGEFADGIVLNLAPLEALPRMLEHIDAGAKRSGRRVEDLEIACLFNTYVTDDVAKAERDFALTAAYYFSTIVYNKFLAWCGYRVEAEAIAQGFKQRDRSKSLNVLSRELIHKLAIIGNEQECRDRVRAYWKAGINTPIIGGDSLDHDVYLRTIRAFTPSAMGA